MTTNDGSVYFNNNTNRIQIYSEKMSSGSSGGVMRYENDNEDLKDKSRCAGARADLKMCLLDSDCCKIHKRTPRECLKTTDGSVPDRCQALRISFFECKHSLMDGRRRFRGPKGY